MRDTPAEKNMNYEHTESGDNRIQQNWKIEMFHFSGKVLADFWRQILQVFPLMSLIFDSLRSVFYMSKTVKACAAAFY